MASSRFIGEIMVFDLNNACLQMARDYTGYPTVPKSATHFDKNYYIRQLQRGLQANAGQVGVKGLDFYAIAEFLLVCIFMEETGEQNPTKFRGMTVI
jgi:hypothetical protein